MSSEGCKLLQIKHSTADWTGQSCNSNKSLRLRNQDLAEVDSYKPYFQLSKCPQKSMRQDIDYCRCSTNQVHCLSALNYILFDYPALSEAVL